VAKEKEKERDWDKEMREVDKLLAKLPAADPTLGRAPPHAAPIPRAPGTAPAVLPAGHASSREWLGTWARVGLGLLIGIGMTQWPYTHGCGLRLWFYLAGVTTVVVAGVWSSISSWRRRLATAHVLSQGLIIWGLILAAREILPRIGYAKTVATWFCP